MPASLQDVCSSAECLAKREKSCTKTLSCGCFCCGIKDEKECLPCLKCVLRCESEYCIICGVEQLHEAPCIQNSFSTGCKHVYHYSCVEQKIKAGSSGARISFTFRCCPQDKKPFEHYSLDQVLAPIKALESRVHKMAMDRLIYECRQNDKELKDPQSPYYNDQLAYAMVKSFILYSFFEICSICTYFFSVIHVKSLILLEGINVKKVEDLMRKSLFVHLANRMLKILKNVKLMERIGLPISVDIAVKLQIGIAGTRLM